MPLTRKKSVPLAQREVPVEGLGLSACGGNRTTLKPRGEVGDRCSGDCAPDRDDDPQAVMGAGGRGQFRHKDGTPYAGGA